MILDVPSGYFENCYNTDCRNSTLLAGGRVGTEHGKNWQVSPNRSECFGDPKPVMRGGFCFLATIEFGVFESVVSIPTR